MARHETFQVLTDRECEALLSKYADDIELWNRFWLFMGEQVAKGASVEYVQASYRRLETRWQESFTSR